MAPPPPRHHRNFVSRVRLSFPFPPSYVFSIPIPPSALISLLSSKSNSSLTPSQTQLTKLINASQTLHILRTGAQAAWMPYHSQSIPFKAVAEATAAEQDAQTAKWTEMKLAELNIVSVTGALIASVVTSTLAWTPPNPFSAPKPWTVTALWLSSLLFALFSVVLATQQSVVLTRASTGAGTLLRIRVLMGATLSPPGSASTAAGGANPSRGEGARGADIYKSNNTLLFTWQAATMCLGVSIVLLVVGLLVVVFLQVKQAGNWGDEAKIAIWVGISGVFCVGTYLVSWADTEVRFQRLCVRGEKGEGEGVDEA